MSLSSNQPKTIDAILRHLQFETALQLQFQESLNAERVASRQFEAEKVLELVQEREALTHQIREARERRLSLTSEAFGVEGRSLTELVSIHLQGRPQRDILAAIQKLQDAVRETVEQTREHNQVVTFALNLVNGCLSTIYGSSRTCTTNYSGRGMKTSNYSPAFSRHEGVLQKA